MKNSPEMPNPSTAATSPPASQPPVFDWPLANEAEALVRDQIEVFLQKNLFAQRLARRMTTETGTDFFEWVDHLVLPQQIEAELSRVGFEMENSAEAPAGLVVYEHPRATLPRILLASSPALPFTIALRPEFVADFKAQHHLRADLEGEPNSQYRRLLVSQENGTRLEAVERRAYRGFKTSPLSPEQLRAITLARDLWQSRPRLFADDSEGVRFARQLLDRSLELVGRDLSCQFFFESERRYWENRNTAARLQKHRQDRLGLGWGNHDHHTFRSSREHFVDLIDFLVALGFEKRERYYAGAEAGWGAQISEQSTTGIVVFADVDLMPDETAIDFSSRKLPAAPRLGTVGLWVGLHGESFLEAGMHHLEARFDFDMLRDQLKLHGINSMKPFSDFAFLRQAFTEGERWPVRKERADILLNRKLISPAQYTQFIQDGALGSHLENLQRHGGFKGFNQKSVSVVISATDPRKNIYSGSKPGSPVMAH